ncbi:hypothetical protein EVAR_33484_1 [Eumeta japonica]|uniref:Uncharacterized protein n=1 Tax=Eumeta variegata TaxID=151549 RepID=A0A4C1WFW9_EUMVA|nr:hypothetical protein EVAR_33484_1 [Eumeta japonica]
MFFHLSVCGITFVGTRVPNHKRPLYGAGPHPYNMRFFVGERLDVGNETVIVTGRRNMNLLLQYKEITTITQTGPNCMILCEEQKTECSNAFTPFGVRRGAFLSPNLAETTRPAILSRALSEPEVQVYLRCRVCPIDATAAIVLNG